MASIPIKYLPKGILGISFLKIVLTEYDVRPINKRLAAFAQDSWSIGEKLVVNAGVRFNQWRGELEGDPLNRGNVFSPKLGIAPRIGITYDLFKNHSTALKAHYGKYYHGFINFIYIIAISVYVLVAIMKKRLKLEQSLYTILQILSITLFEKTLISWAFTENYYKNKMTSDHIQLKLFDS